jgi:lipopolysaccharide export system ATP-binding protein
VTPKRPALVATALTAHLGDARVLDGLDFEALPGRVTCVFGPSGAGKSTLFRALAGDQAPTSGRVEVLGHDVTRWPLWRRARLGIGYVPQTPSVLFDLTVDANFESFAAFAPAFSATRARELSAVLGLAGRSHVRAAELSGGERRKLELVRALAAGPRVLICDEPFAALDPAGKEATCGELRRLADSGSAVLVADHDVRAALGISDTAYLLLAGRMAVSGAPTDFAEDPQVRAHYVSLG